MKKLKLFLIIIVIAVLLSVAYLYLRHTSIPVLQPRGQIANEERNLLFFALGLSAVVVIPVFIMLFGIAWKYRESNTSAKYSPDFDHSRIAETIWWAIPTVLITILSVVTWNSSHNLDPYKPISSAQKPIVIQAISLDWKWLFIYPDQKVASVNYAQFPTGRPVNFEITSDSVMNSFWIPQLGGQIYAMPGMSTQLHLIADKDGSYYGSSANISGSGFAGMNFMASATKTTVFNNWINNLHETNNSLTYRNYKLLARPSSNNLVSYYSSTQPNLYDTILMKYDGPGTAMSMANMGGL